MSRNKWVVSGFQGLLGLLLALSVSACGVVFGGTTKNISVGSTPAEARLTTEPLTGSFTTPATLTLERKKSYTLVVWREGYEEAQYPITRSIRVVPLVLDIFCLACVIIDAVTGGWWDLQPDEVTVTLARIGDASFGPELVEVTISSLGTEAGPITVAATEAVHLQVVEN